MKVNRIIQTNYTHPCSVSTGILHEWRQGILPSLAGGVRLILVVSAIRVPYEVDSELYVVFDEKAVCLVPAVDPEPIACVDQHIQCENK